MKKLLVTILGLSALAAQGQFQYTAVSVSLSNAAVFVGDATNILNRVTSGGYLAGAITNNAVAGAPRYVLSSINVITPAAVYCPPSGIVSLTVHDNYVSNQINTATCVSNYYAAWTSNYWGTTNYYTYMTNTTGWFTNAATGQGYGTVNAGANVGISPATDALIVTNIDVGYCMFPVAVAAAWAETPTLLTVSQPAGTSVTYPVRYSLSKGLCIRLVNGASNVVVTAKYTTW